MAPTAKPPGTELQGYPNQEDQPTHSLRAWHHISFPTCCGLAACRKAIVSLGLLYTNCYLTVAVNCTSTIPRDVSTTILQPRIDSGVWYVLYQPVSSISLQHKNDTHSPRLFPLVVAVKLLERTTRGFDLRPLRLDSGANGR